MNSPFTLEAEPFEIEDPEFTEEPCQCPKCRAARDGSPEEFEPELTQALWSAHLGPGRSVPRTEMPEEAAPRPPASHRTLGRGRVVSRKALLGETSDELELIGSDDRVPVTGTTAVPFRWCCSLDLFFPDPDDATKLIQFVGSGTLISPRHVLTAGHCLLDEVAGSAGTSKRVPVAAIAVVPGRNGGNNPLGAAAMQHFNVSATWLAGPNPRFDYGVITLVTAIGDETKAALGGQRLGFWGSPTHGAGTVIAPRTQAQLNAVPVNISGYPADKPSGTQWRSFGKVVNTAPAAGAELIYYDLDTCGGHSGSPIWLRSQNVRNLIAIHTGSCILGTDCAVVPGAACFPDTQRRTSNRGVRITPTVLSDIRTWTATGSATKLTLRRGAKGAPVIELQTRLNAWRAKTPGIGVAPLVIDGDFGGKTDAMVRTFQRAKGLAVDGVVGPLTWGAVLSA